MYPGAGVENVLVTHGSAEANFVTMWRQVEPGDEVVVLLPNYMQVPGLARNFGAKVKPFYLKEDKGWSPDLDELRAQVTAKTKLIYVTNPNNPTGAVMDGGTMEAIVDVAESVGAWILADEVYRGAELAGDISPSFWGMADKVLVVSGLSKAFALQGLRIGWLVGPKDMVDEIWGYSDYTTITTGAISARLAQLAMRQETRDKIRRRNREIMAGSLTVLTDWLSGHSELLRFVRPKIGGVAFVGYNLDIKSTDLVMKLLHERSVLIAPGEFCGLDGYVRIGYGSKDLSPGLELIGAVLEELKDGHR